MHVLFFLLIVPKIAIPVGKCYLRPIQHCASFTKIAYFSNIVTVFFAISDGFLAGRLGPLTGRAVVPIGKIWDANRSSWRGLAWWGDCAFEY